MSDLPQVLTDLSPDEQVAAIQRMRAMARAHLGRQLVRQPERSMASITSAFFERRRQQEQLGATDAGRPLGATRPGPEQVNAELERLRTGKAALLNKPQPTEGWWRKSQFPRRGWALLRIEDTGVAGGALCEVCEKATMRQGYVLSHPAWPPPSATSPLGAIVYSCRLCAAHLLGGTSDIRESPPCSPTASASSQPRPGELRPYRKPNRRERLARRARREAERRPS